MVTRARVRLIRVNQLLRNQLLRNRLLRNRLLRNQLLRNRLLRNRLLRNRLLRNRLLRNRLLRNQLLRNRLLRNQLLRNRLLRNRLLRNQLLRNQLHLQKSVRSPIRPRCQNHTESLIDSAVSSRLELDQWWTRYQGDADKLMNMLRSAVFRRPLFVLPLKYQGLGTTDLGDVSPALLSRTRFSRQF
jgi:hypothetical protein